jgi:EAL domain-containing protein (putative c-di-GMP-specific phosphodiesterase class I)
MSNGYAVDLIGSALAFDRLRLEAQPIVALRDCSIASEELLVRICDEEGELVLPRAFIPPAEQYGLMPMIDRYVIDHAAARTCTGRAVHVNLSATTIAQRGLFDDIVTVMREHSAKPEQITFEITETAAAIDLTEASHLGTRLAARGFRIALDDFGSGWGAFRYLKALPVRLIKIDCEFVRDLTSSPRAVELVGAIVTLARMLGHETVGEGVENEATFSLLRSLGVNYGQGYYLGRPAPAEPSPSSPLNSARSSSDHRVSSVKNVTRIPTPPST